MCDRREKRKRDHVESARLSCYSSSDDCAAGGRSRSIRTRNYTPVSGQLQVRLIL